MSWQSPKGTRDFYPDDMAWQNYLFDAWRRVSIRHGFEQVDGPIFELLDLYKVKSGEGIVSELFHFTDRGERELAIRPEFTPTLARMVAAKANSLPKPIKWFCTPNLCRAERPQRGRLREFWQWNVDMLGSDAPIADAEVILVAVDLLRELGLQSDQVRVRISHRAVVRKMLERLGVPDDKMVAAFELLDRRAKMVPEQFLEQAKELGLDAARVERFEQMCRRRYPAGDLAHLSRSVGLDGSLDDLMGLDTELKAFGIADWCEYDLGIVRGLAYYTGMVFELHEATGVERALAGGGRYDHLIRHFGGPDTPAVGFGMGDVVLSNILRDKRLIPEHYAPRPDAFVLGLTDTGVQHLPSLVASLRKQGLHTRFSYKSTRNLGKLMKEASSTRARFAIMLDDAVEQGQAQIKCMETGEQNDIKLNTIFDRLKNHTD